MNRVCSKMKCRLCWQIQLSFCMNAEQGIICLQWSHRTISFDGDGVGRLQCYRKAGKVLITQVYGHNETSDRRNFNKAPNLVMYLEDKLSLKGRHLSHHTVKVSGQPKFTVVKTLSLTHHAQCDQQNVAPCRLLNNLQALVWEVLYAVVVYTERLKT